MKNVRSKIGNGEWNEEFGCRVARLEEYPGYLFLEDGRVWGERKGKFLKPALRSNGKAYRIIPINSSGKPMTKSVHRLIYCAFWPDDSLDNYEIDHIDRNVANNALTNLRKVTSRENKHNRSDNNPFPSVGFHKQTNKYQVTIFHKYYGLFLDHLSAVLHSIHIHRQLNIPLSPLQISYLESNNINYQ